VQVTAAGETSGHPFRIGLAEIAVLALLAGIPLVYFPGFTFEYTHLKLPLFQIVAVIGLAALVMRASAPGRWLRQRLLLIGPAALLLAWMFASVAWHRYRWAAPAGLVRETSFLLGFLGLSFLLSATGTRKLYARWLVAAAVVAAVFIICFISTGSPGYFGNRNLAGGFLVLPITAALAFVVGPSGNVSARKYWSLAAGLLIMIYALWFTRSGGALAGAVLGALLVCFVLFKGSRRYLAAAGVVAALAGAAYIVFRPDVMRQLFGVRALIWRGTIDLIASAPLLGQGAGAFAAAIRAFQPMEYFAHPAAAPVTAHAHCYPLEIMAELGAGGVALYASLLAGLLLAARRAVRNAADGFDRCVLVGIACGLAGMVLHGIVSVGPTSPGVQINFWLGAAFICGAMATGPTGEKARRIRRLPVAIVLLAAFAAAFYSLSWKSFSAQRYAARAVRLKQPTEKLALLKKAKNLQPYETKLSVSMRMKTAAAYFPLKRLDNALAEYAELESLSANFGGINASIARVHQLMGNYSAAAHYAERAAHSNPFDTQAYAIWLDALRHGATEPPATAATELLSMAEKLKPFEAALEGLNSRIEGGRPFDRPFFNYTAGIIKSALDQADFLKHAGRATEAERFYAKASRQCAALAECIGERPAAALPLFNLWMQAGSESGKPQIFKEGAAALEKLLTVAGRGGRAPSSRAQIELYYLLAAFHYNSGQQQKAALELREVAAWCQRALRSGADDPWVLGLLARAYEILHPRLSFEIAKKLLEQDPHNPIARSLIYTLKQRAKAAQSGRPKGAGER